ncbi:hypothetical protein BAUCODRAFT_261947 [Baudoinia panamericana UAMH 10762]|uniref:Uncharacterized protein n=1 Tax=Baudoinia panamericana (strain UAMH 10762) TaxID=717646 RepID=M2N268_BAUPA|nr:uncharacterized protein BAUCODRAFT_261947 [Baudoinia panamericana UAMH 10762]EMC92775.1 hypothetical protein BAUCODRAFT_261947 [Baudoinia panamericana UAMH 10762]
MRSGYTEEEFKGITETALFEPLMLVYGPLQLLLLHRLNATRYFAAFVAPLSYSPVLLEPLKPELRTLLEPMPTLMQPSISVLEMTEPEFLSFLNMPPTLSDPYTSLPYLSTQQQSKSLLEMTELEFLALLNMPPTLPL